MQLTLILTTLTALATTALAGPIPQPLPDADTLNEIAELHTRSLEARAEQAQQAQALAQAHAIAQLRQNRQWGYPRGGRFRAAGGGLDLSILGLADLAIGGGNVQYCSWPSC